MQDTLSSFTKEQLSILTGSLLGDAHISSPRSFSPSCSCSFTKSQAERRKEYLDWHFYKLQPFSSSINTYNNYANGKKYRKSVFLTHVHEDFKILRQKWYPFGEKIVPLDLKLDPLSIAVWFFDDGSNDLEARSCKLSTYCFDRKECEFLCFLLEEFNISTRIDNRNVIYVRPTSYKIFTDLVKEVLSFTCFNYKLVYRDIKVRLTKDSSVKEIFRLYQEDKLNLTQIAEIMDVGIDTVSAILRGKRKKHLGIKPIEIDPSLPLSNTSGVKYVSWDKNRLKWMAVVKRKHLGRFDTLEEAKNAVDEFKKLN